MPQLFNTICITISIISTLVGLLFTIKLKENKNYIIFFLIPFTVILCLTNIYFFVNDDSKIYEFWYIITGFLPLVFATIFKSKRKKLSLITAYLNVLLSIYFVFTINNGFSPFVENKHLLRLMIYSIGLTFMSIYLGIIYNRLHDLVENTIPKYLSLLMIYGLIIIIEIAVYRMLLNTTELRVLRLEIFGVAIMSIYFVSLVGFYYFLKKQNIQEIEDKEKMILENHINTILAQYKTKEAKEEELRIIRHDMKHILITVSSLLNQKKYGDAEKFVNAYVSIIGKTAVKQYCKDPIIDTVIGYYHHKCKENNIKFDVKINDIEAMLKMPTHEVGVLISNCLDNAINASKKLETNRQIKFYFLNNNGRLVLRVKNNFDGNIIYDSAKMPTNKEKNHGIGSKSIKRFTEKYHLMLDYKISEKEFEITILFN